MLRSGKNRDPRMFATEILKFMKLSGTCRYVREHQTTRECFLFGTAIIPWSWRAKCMDHQIEEEEGKTQHHQSDSKGLTVHLAKLGRYIEIRPTEPLYHYGSVNTISFLIINLPKSKTDFERSLISPYIRSCLKIVSTKIRYSIYRWSFS